MESNSQGALLCLTTKRKVGWLTNNPPTRCFVEPVTGIEPATH